MKTLLILIFFAFIIIAPITPRLIEAVKLKRIGNKKRRNKLKKLKKF